MRWRRTSVRSAASLDSGSRGVRASPRALTHSLTRVHAPADRQPAAASSMHNEFIETSKCLSITS
jgi:hypothetical protein